MRVSLPRALTNPLSLFGALIATLGLGASIFALVIDLLRGSGRPYLGILTFFFFPLFLFLGLFFVALGALLKRRRLKRTVGPAGPALPVLDFNRPAERRLYLAFGGITLFILLCSVLGSYRAYEFTESVTFCGQVCHSVMKPEYTAYQNSPHARVKCVECHVGSGADWYLKAKVSGLRQVYSLLTGKYPRPIPTPLTNLRPAQDTCEQCHWPEKSWGEKLSSRIRYGFEALNPRHEVLVLMNVGGGGQGRPGEGIHWHMNLKNRLEYIARDAERLDIAWVRSTSPEGVTMEYVDPEKPPTAGELAKLERRRMDCLDCHNRPSHVFLTASEAVDRSLQAGLLDAAVPHLKEAAVSALCGKYATAGEADERILPALQAFYEQKHPALAAGLSSKLKAAAAEVKRVYHQNFFPEMGVSWASYPDHIGHRESPGCFRCHDDRHRSQSGKVIKKDCDLCHTLMTRTGDGHAVMPASNGAAFLHPWKHEKHSRLDCWSCHNGKASPYDACSRCHEPEQGAPMAFACSGCHKPLKVKVENSECTSCHGLVKSKLHALKGHQDCLACHKQHEWKTVSYPDDCTEACHQDLKKPHHPGEPCAPCHDFRGVTSTLGKPPP